MLETTHIQSRKDSCRVDFKQAGVDQLGSLTTATEIARFLAKTCCDKGSDATNPEGYLGPVVVCEYQTCNNHSAHKYTDVALRTTEGVRTDRRHTESQGRGTSPLFHLGLTDDPSCSQEEAPAAEPKKGAQKGPIGVNLLVQAAPFRRHRSDHLDASLNWVGAVASLSPTQCVLPELLVLVCLGSFPRRPVRG
jgi:hypothetical protein